MQDFLTIYEPNNEITAEVLAMREKIRPVLESPLLYDKTHQGLSRVGRRFLFAYALDKPLLAADVMTGGGSYQQDGKVFNTIRGDIPELADKNSIHYAHKILAETLGINYMKTGDEISLDATALDQLITRIANSPQEIQALWVERDIAAAEKPLRSSSIAPAEISKKKEFRHEGIG